MSKWIAMINESPEDQCVQDTACEAVVEALTWYNEQQAHDDNGEGALTLEVMRMKRVDLPKIGEAVADLLIESTDDYMADEGMIDAPRFEVGDEARQDLAARIDALVTAWADKHDARPDWYEQAGRAVLTLELAWGEDGDGPLAVITDEQWAQIESLGAQQEGG